MAVILDELLSKKESQTFDRKSARKEPKSLSNHFVVFANADGGMLAIGIEDNGEVTGIDDYIEHINDISRVGYDYCKPSIRVTTEILDCTDKNGRANHIMVIHIPQSTEMHANQHDEVYYRVGDRSHKLNFDERLQLLYAKGGRYYEDEPVFRSSLDDIDWEFVKNYCRKIGYTKSPEDYIKQNHNFYISHDGRTELSGVAVLLFGKEPQSFFPRARIRFVRYEGTEAKVGAEMNVIKDRCFGGKILDMVQQSIAFVGDQLKERTYLGKDGRFITVPEYPEFAWKELIVNAVAHRDYSIKGTDIQIKMFDDHITVESPGILPGIVRLNNLRTVHFSRNPQIAQFLHEYDYVQEFGEGIDRMFREMAAVGLPAPEYQSNSFMLHATIRNATKDGVESDVENGVESGVESGVENLLSDNEKSVLNVIKKNPTSSAQTISKNTGIPFRTVQRVLKSLRDKEVVHHVGPAKGGRWEIL